MSFISLRELFLLHLDYKSGFFILNAIQIKNVNIKLYSNEFLVNSFSDIYHICMS